MENKNPTLNYYGTLMIINRYKNDPVAPDMNKYIYSKEFIGSDLGYLIHRHTSYVIKKGFLVQDTFKQTYYYHISFLAFTYTMSCYEDMLRINNLMKQFKLNSAARHLYLSSGNTDEYEITRNITRFFKLERSKPTLGVGLYYDTLNDHVPDLETIQGHYRRKYRCTKPNETSALTQLMRVYDGRLSLETSYENFEKLPFNYKFSHDILQRIMVFLIVDDD